MTSRDVHTTAVMPPALAVRAISLMLLILLPIGSWLFPNADFAAQLGREGIFWVSAIAVIGFVALVERRPLASLGVRPPRWTSLILGIGGAAVIVAGMALIYLVLFPALNLSDAGTTASLLSTPLWFRIGLVTRAAVFEELFFRGFMIERLSVITNLRWLAAIISLVAFTISHLSGWGWAHLIVAGFGGVVLTGLYLWRRDLLTNMIAHFVTDAIGFLLG
jgi:membrane protease YdiL (CAAX protease family)